MTKTDWKKVSCEICKKEVEIPDDKAACLGKGVGFERIRRITGYLVGSLERFNNAKRCEERDRVKHGTGAQPLADEAKRYG